MISAWVGDPQSGDELLQLEKSNFGERKLSKFKCRTTYRSSRPEVFCKKGVLRNFAKFTKKQL